MAFLHGLRTVVYGGAPDLARVTAWYRDVLGFAPYFEEPYYVGFNVGGYELGIVPDRAPADGSAFVYWGVDDADAALERLLSLGATAHDPIQDVGDGVRLGAVHDPFGNVFGIIENPHFKLA